MERKYKVYEIKNEEKILREFTIADEPAAANLNTLFLMEYGAAFRTLLNDFDYHAVERLAVGDTHTHYIRADWTIDVQRTK